MDRFASSAQATSDHVIRYLSPLTSDHPLDVPAHEVVMEAPLTREQYALAKTLLAGEGAISPLVRSAIAQLGVDIDADEVKLTPSSLRIEGRLFAVPNSPGDRLMQLMQSLHQRYELFVGRAALLPESSRLSFSEIEDAVHEGYLSANGSQIKNDGRLLLPLQSEAHVFHQNHPSDEALRNVLLGTQSGRAALQDSRSVKKRAEVLPSRDFVIGSIDVHTSDYHVILDRETVDASGDQTHTIHLGAFLLDAGRTRAGTRHVELWNANGSPTNLEDLHVVTRVYRAAERQEPGI